MCARINEQNKKKKLPKKKVEKSDKEGPTG